MQLSVEIERVLRVRALRCLTDGARTNEWREGLTATQPGYVTPFSNKARSRARLLGEVLQLLQPLVYAKRIRHVGASNLESIYRTRGRILQPD